MRAARLSLLAAALAFIAVATLTPGSTSFVGSERPDFWCLACGATGGGDVIVNVLLFVPLGVAIALFDMPVPRVFLTGLLVSVAIEFAQRAGFPPSRVFNATDMITNSAGAFIGGWLTHTRRRWLRPSVRAAQRLVIASVSGVSALLVLTAWSLSPNPHATDAPPAGPSRSSYTHGYGWYHGLITRVTLGDTSLERTGGFSIAHAGDGPVILEGASFVRGVRVELSGRDEREGFVPFVFLNDARDNEPDLLLGQQGADARLSVRLRGARLRLPAPRLVLRNAFAPDVSAGQAASDNSLARDGNGEKVVVAKVSPAEWVLAVSNNPRQGEAQIEAAERSSSPPGLSARLVISLGVGWTLYQGVVALDHRFAPLVTVAWMLVLWLPVGYWCTFAGAREELHPRPARAERGNSLRWPVASLVVLGLVLAGAPRWAGIADCSLAEWCMAIAGYASGVFFATRVQRNQKWFEALRSGQPRLNPLQ